MRLKKNIELNCCDFVSGDDTGADSGGRLFQMMLDAASGTATKSEQHGYGQNEFVPWYVGAVM